MEKRRDELELLFLKNKQNSKNKKEFLDGKDGFIIGVGMLIFMIACVSGYAKGAISLVAIETAICIIFRYALPPKKYYHIVTFVALLAANYLLLENAAGWNEGSMSSRYYYIDFLGSASDFLYAFILISAFLLSIPIIWYIAFLYSISKTTYREPNQNQNTNEQNKNSKEK